MTTPTYSLTMLDTVDWDRVERIAGYLWKGALAVAAGLGVKSLGQGVHWFMGPRFRAVIEEITAPERKAMQDAAADMNRLAADMRVALSAMHEETRNVGGCREQVTRLVTYVASVEDDMLDAVELATDSAKERRSEMDDVWCFLDRMIGIDEREPRQARELADFATIGKTIRGRRRELRAIRRAADVDSGTMPALGREDEPETGR